MTQTTSSSASSTAEAAPSPHYSAVRRRRIPQQKLQTGYSIIPITLQLLVALRTRWAEWEFSLYPKTNTTKHIIRIYIYFADSQKQHKFPWSHLCVCGNKNRYFSVSLPLAVALHTIKNKRVKEWRARLLLLRFGWSLGLNRTYLIQLLMVFPINIINISYIYTNTKLARRIFVSLSICCVYLCYHVSLFFSWLWDWEGLLLEVVKISARDCR